jgi:plasmid maintenance system antidote protein VapI
MERHATGVAELARATGVSADVIKKLRTREGASTTAENALLIASFYGKSVNDFIAMRETSEATATLAMLDLLSEEERRILRSQIQGLIDARGR